MSSIIRIIEDRLEKDTSQTSFTYLRDGENDTSRISLTGIRDNANRIAAHYFENNHAGLYDTHLEIMRGITNKLIGVVQENTEKVNDRRKELERKGRLLI